MATTRESAEATNPGPAGMFDRDVDPSPALVSVRGSRRSGSRERPIECYQRLVANPFLAAFGLVAWMGFVGVMIGYYRIDISLLYFVLVLPIGYLFQFHCRDCGATARLSRWRSHRCPTVEHRIASGRPRRLRGPSPPMQTVLWVLAFPFAFWFVVRQIVGS